MNPFEIVTHGPLWKVGGILTECEWDWDPADLLMWDGSSERIEPGDKVLILQRGVPYASFVAVYRT